MAITSKSPPQPIRDKLSLLRNHALFRDLPAPAVTQIGHGPELVGLTCVDLSKFGKLQAFGLSHDTDIVVRLAMHPPRPVREIDPPSSAGSVRHSI